MNILFVCRGNVGRSQMAEAMFNALAGSRHRALSCGTKVFDKEGRSMQGQPLKDLASAQETIASLAALGLQVSECRRDQVTPKLVASADRVVIMAEPDTVPDFLKHHPGIVTWEIDDPKGKDRQATDAIRDAIAVRVQTLVDELDRDQGARP